MVSIATTMTICPLSDETGPPWGGRIGRKACLVVQVATNDGGTLKIVVVNKREALPQQIQVDS